MKCSFCQQPLQYVHGHGACLNNQCPLYGQNQAPCCDGAPQPDEGLRTPPSDDGKESK